MKPTQQVGPMPTEQRAKIKRLAEAAIPGPWQVYCDGVVSGKPGEHSCRWVSGGNEECPTWQTQEYIAAASPDVVLGLLQQLAAAEARATEAAAEAAKWKAEARAHAARCAVLEKADAAPYCEGQCGICDCETAPVAPQVGFGPEDGWIADLLSGTIPVEGQPAAPAPVAPQQQEGDGQ